MKSGQKMIGSIIFWIVRMYMIFLLLQAFFSPSALGVVTLTGDTSKPTSSTFIMGDTVELSFVVSGLPAGDNSQALYLTIVDELEQTISSMNFAVSADLNGQWSGSVYAPNSEYGFYRVYAELTNDVTISKLSSRPEGYITYCIIPDPSMRQVYPSNETFFGIFGGVDVSDIFSYLGARWTVNNWLYGWRHVEPNNPGQLKDLLDGGSYSPPTAPWLQYQIAPTFIYPDTWNVFPVIADTCRFMTGTLTAQGEIWWAEFCEQVARKYILDNPTMVEDLYQITWEPVYNEIPSLSGFNGTDEDIIKIHEIAYPVLHAKDPKAVVMGPTSMNILYDVDFNRRLFRKGLGKYLDAFSIHTYTMMGTTMLTDEITFLRNVLLLKEIIYTSCGKNLPWYSTEQGFQTLEVKANEIIQARGVIRSNLIMMGEGFRSSVTYYIHDPDEENLHGYGLYYNLNPAMNYGTNKIGPKPVVPAYAFMTWLLDGYKSAGSIEWLGDSGMGYAYERNGNIILAMWDYSDNPASVTIPAGVSQVLVYDWMGNPTTVTTCNGLLQVTLSKQPIYIVGADVDLWMSSADKKLLLDESRITSSPGSLAIVTGKLLSQGSTGVDGVITIKADDRLNLGAINAVNISAPVGGEQAFSYQFKIPSTVAVGSYPIAFTLWENSVPKQSVRFMVNVVSPVTQSPVFSVAGPHITGPTSVTISCSTSGAMIYYTTDGSMPSTCGTVYSSPVAVDDGTVLKAVAFGDDISLITSQKYSYDNVIVFSEVASEDANPSEEGSGNGRGLISYSYMYPGSVDQYHSPAGTPNEWMYTTITQWDLSNNDGAFIDDVVSANVRFMVSGNYSPTGSYSGTYYFYRLLEPFNESSVTWDTKPPIDPSTCVVWHPDAGTTNGNFANIDVSNLLEKNGNLGTFGIACIQIGGYPGAFFVQREAGGTAQPLLEATYHATSPIVCSEVASEDANPSEEGPGYGRGLINYSYMFPGSSSAQYFSPAGTMNEWMYATITQWNLPDNNGAKIVDVVSANVRFMVSGNYSPTGPYSGTYYFYRLAEAFDESSVTWNTKPAIDSSSFVVWSPDTGTANGNFVNIDVSSLLANNGNLETFGIACIQIGGYPGSFLVQREAGGTAQPLLEATYYASKVMGN